MLHPQTTDVPVDLKLASTHLEVSQDGAVLEDQRTVQQPPDYKDPFGNDEDAKIRYKTMRWW